MASSPSSPQVEEPVLHDSLSYWEKQKATYDGVLGVSACLSHVSPAHPKLSFATGAGGYGSGVRSSFYILAIVKLTYGSYM